MCLRTTNSYRSFPRKVLDLHYINSTLITQYNSSVLNISYLFATNKSLFNKQNYILKIEFPNLELNINRISFYGS